VGPWYVLADELVPSASRSSAISARSRRRGVGLGGRADVLYSPDAFGIQPSAALAAEFGITCGVVWRGSAASRASTAISTAGAPLTAGRILLLHLRRPGTNPAPAWSKTALARQRVDALRQSSPRRAVTSHIAVAGRRDHHAAPVSIGRVRDLIARLEPEADVRVSRLDEYFRAAAAEQTASPSSPASCAGLTATPGRCKRCTPPCAAQAPARGGGAVARARGRAALPRARHRSQTSRGAVSSDDRAPVGRCTPSAPAGRGRSHARTRTSSRRPAAPATGSDVQPPMDAVNCERNHASGQASRRACDRRGRRRQPTRRAARPRARATARLRVAGA